MKGVCCSLPIQLVGVNKFEALAKMNQPSLVSVKYRDNKVYLVDFVISVFHGN